MNKYQVGHAWGPQDFKPKSHRALVLFVLVFVVLIAVSLFDGEPNVKECLYATGRATLCK